MASTQAFCSSFKGDLLAGRARLVTGQTGHRVALYTSTATHSAATTQYTANNEVTGTGYTAKGELITIPASVPTVSGTTGIVDFTNVTWSTSTITAASSLVFDDSATTPVIDAALIVNEFGGDKSSSAGDFTISWPAFDASNAIIRLT